MAIPLLIEPEADQELEEAAVRYDEERAGLGKRFLDEVAVTLDRLGRFPQAGAPVPFVPADLPARRAPVKGFPYHVVYLIDASRRTAECHPMTIWSLQCKFSHSPRLRLW